MWYYKRIALEHFIPFIQEGINKGLLNILEDEDELDIKIYLIDLKT